jgi:hypothetical protein
MPDFTIGNNPYAPPLDSEVGNPVFIFPPRLPVGSPVGLLRFRAFSTSFKLRSLLPRAAVMVAPFTILSETPGVLHVLLDVAFYTQSGNAIEFVAEQARLAADWTRTTAETNLEGAFFDVFDRRRDLYPVGSDVRIIVDVPPMWLRDP